MKNNDVLRTVMHGASKKQVLERIDTINSLVIAVQSGSMFREQALEEAQRLADEPFNKALNGFNEEDAQNYLRKLMEMI